MRRTYAFPAVLLSACLIAGALSVALPAYSQAPAGDKAVATVNGEPLGEAAFMTALLARYGDRTLNALITNLVIAQAAKAAKVEATVEEVGLRYVATERTIETRAPMSGENFEMWLAKRSLTREYFRTELYYQLLLEKMVESQVKLADTDVSDFYQRNREAMKEPAMVRVAHVCVQTVGEARQIRADIVQGKIEWNEAVKKYTLDPWTKDTGGDLGFLEAGDTPPLIKAASLLRNNGDLSEPVQSAMGFHVLKRLGYREARTPPFEEVEASIREQLRRTQLNNLTAQKRQEILQAAKVERTLQIAPEPPPPATIPPAPAGGQPAAPK